MDQRRTGSGAVNEGIDVMDREKFYQSLRSTSSGVFGTSLSHRQVDGTNAILDAGKGLPVSYVAHVFGEVYHETGGGMYPVKETVFPYSKDKNPSDATVIARLDSAFAKGRLPWVSAPYWRDGMFGRGQIQLTHGYNYREISPLVGVDLVSEPGRALDLPVSAAIAVKGCFHGIFTGKRLGDYDKGSWFDHVNARAIVNGDKNKRARGATKTNGEKVAAYAEAFEAALIAGGWGETAPAAPPPAPEQPTTAPTPAMGFAAALRAIFAALFGKVRK